MVAADRRDGAGGGTRHDVGGVCCPTCPDLDDGKVGAMMREQAEGRSRQRLEIGEVFRAPPDVGQHISKLAILHQVSRDADALVDP